ncbi:SusC/RagA family TonB-linked outer membrane protein [Mucilaginibacter boryungensis]|uniref:TonB-dependent receptor n=1 Tax=Mucilaginibacter boryungensis TaxID=768480 RepID=A0ABR9XFE3_9SPHI|nr:TonB-dependent receptor [Mucilaginibacter boryungensis]MBE9666113.1 TonB-dependent receptor [Mucilaginibacter boryungensis]
MKKSFTKTNGFYKKCTGILLLLFCLISTATFAAKPVNVTALPPQTITGIVKDQNGNTLPGVTIKVKDKTVGTLTDATGKFKLTVPAGSHIIIVSFIGYIPQEIDINGRSAFDITLVDDVSKLKEVVVVGYGSQSREKLTTSVSKLDARVLNNVTYTNVGSALEGNISGLQVQSTGGGQPGASPRIVLRGGTSITNPNGASPLYIVDGIIRPNGLNDINSASIESVQVLKDAASTAIYGARGSNGVVIVTTRAGKPNQNRVSYTFNGSAGNASRLLQYSNAHDYIYWNRLGVQAASFYQSNPNTYLAKLSQTSAYGTANDLTNNTPYTTQYLTAANQFKLSQGWQSMPDPIDPTKTIIYDDNDFQKTLYRTGKTNDHYLDISGGGDKATFYAGLGYTNAQGAAIETNYKRLSINFNGSYKVNDDLSFFGRLAYTNRTWKTVASLANEFYRSASLPHSAKLTFEDGTYAPGQNSSIGNPLYYYTGPYSPQGKSGDEVTTISLGSKWNIIKGLSFDPQVSLFRQNTPSYSFQPAAYLNGILSPIVTTRNQSSSAPTVRQYQADAVLTYVNTFASKHNLEVKGGFSHYYRENTTFTVNASGAPTDLITTLNSGATATSITSSVSPLVIQSLFSRVNYDYDGKYLLSANVRYDGASNLGNDHKFGFFPGISVGWNVHKEEFFNNLISDKILQLKLRASYGVNGNISGLGDFQPQGSFSTTTGTTLNYAGLPIVVPGNIPNQDLKWEQSKTFDIGADIGLFNGKVGIVVDYYNRRTDDLLTTVSLPASTGFTSIFTNNGTLQNRGYELELNVDVLPSQSKLKWNTSFNIAHTSRKILKLPNNGVLNNRQGGFQVWDPNTGTYVYMGGLQEGGRPGDLYAFHELGVYPTDAAAANAPIDNQAPSAIKKRFGGDVIWDDLDKNGIIDGRDLVYVGNPYPTLSGGFNNYFTYKSFGLNIRTDFTTGNTIWNYPAVIANAQAQGDASPLQSYLDKMWKAQGDVTMVPRYTWQDQPYNIFRGSVNGVSLGNSTYYEKGDFLCLREVTLSYKLPAQLTRKIGLSGARVNFTGYNLHYFTSYTGLNPEDGGMDNGHYPIVRTFSLGVNITL